MTLELKHIQHYPIGGENALRVMYENDIYGLIGLFDVACSIQRGNTTCVPLIAKVKPLLRPLSDLYKEIDGKVDIVELARMAFRNNGYEFFKIKGKEVLFASKSAIITFRFYDETFRFSDDRNLLEMISYLFSRHYDVFSLIDKGLAIDINTIK